MADNNELLAKGQAIEDYYHLSAPQGRYRTKAGDAARVLGIGIGAKIKDDKVIAESCVRFYVERKIHVLAINERFRIKENYGGFQTDVIETGRFASFNDMA